MQLHDFAITAALGACAQDADCEMMTTQLKFELFG